jgi:hypothetical protein
MVVLPVLLTCSLSLCSVELVARVTFFSPPLCVRFVSRGASSACAAFFMLPGASWLPHVVHLHCFLSLLSPIMFFLLTLECAFIFVDSASAMFSHSLANRFVSRPVF